MLDTPVLVDPSDLKVTVVFEPAPPAESTKLTPCSRARVTKVPQVPPPVQSESDAHEARGLVPPTHVLFTAYVHDFPDTLVVSELVVRFVIAMYRAARRSDTIVSLEER